MCTCARTHVRACMHPLHHQGKDHGLPAHGRGQRSMRTIKKKKIPMHVTCSDAPACAGRSSVCTRSLGGLHEDLVHHHASSHAAVHVCVCVRVCMCTRARGELRAPAVLAAAMCNDPMLGVRAEHCEGATTAKKAKGRFQKPICPSLPGVRLVSPARGRHMRRLGRMLPRAGTRKLSPASAEGLRRETGVLAQLV